MLKHLLLPLCIVTGLPVYSYASNLSPDAVATVRWQPCLNNEFQSWFDSSPPPELRCGYLEVPLQYNQGTSKSAPGNKKMIKLALTLLPAKGRREGSLVAISGGPGMPGINPSVSPDWPVSRLRDTWDIVGYDPRGVGQSTPKIICPDPEEQAGNEDILEVSEAQARAKVASCIKHVGPLVLQHIGTDEAVSDLDRIRQALGEPKLTAISWSYGTKVAALYAERFPSHTRALVLDGVVDLGEDDYTERLNQARGFQQSFERFSVWCATNGSCPLPIDKQQALFSFRALLNRLNEAPLLTADGQAIAADELLSLTYSSLLWSSDWPFLAMAIRQLDAGIISDDVVNEIQKSENMAEDDAFNAINCADVARQDVDVDSVRRQRQEIGKAMAFADYRPLFQYPRDVCDFWPWPGKDRPHLPVRVKQHPQLLFVAQRYDPTTPWRNAQTMAKAFNSPLITLERDGHTLALSGKNLCVDKSVVSYLIKPDEPRNDETCF